MLIAVIAKICNLHSLYGLLKRQMHQDICASNAFEIYQNMMHGGRLWFAVYTQLYVY